MTCKPQTESQDLTAAPLLSLDFASTFTLLYFYLYPSTCSRLLYSLLLSTMRPYTLLSSTLSLRLPLLYSAWLVLYIYCPLGQWEGDFMISSGTCQLDRIIMNNLWANEQVTSWSLKAHANWTVIIFGLVRRWLHDSFRAHVNWTHINLWDSDRVTSWSLWAQVPTGPSMIRSFVHKTPMTSNHQLM